MQYILDGREMKAVDRYTIEEIGIPSAVLMERAAMEVVKVILDKLRGRGHVVIVCGVGNNGADGLAAARLLSEQSVRVSVSVVGDLSRATPEWQLQYKILKNLGVPFCKPGDFAEYDVIVDAIFGIGLTRAVSGAYAEVIAKINEASWAFKIAVDIASGLSANTGEILGVAVEADVTVTFGSKKQGQMLYQGTSVSGQVLVCPIGFPLKSYDFIKPEAFAYEPMDLLRLPKRKENGHKGTFGKVLVVAGSKNMSGAAYLSARAAYRMGAGLVRIFTVEENREILQTALPEAILTTFDSRQLPIPLLEEVCRWADVVVAGPGLGSEDYVRSMMNYLLQYVKTPMVIDADGLNVLARAPHMLELLNSNHILTPHLGEFARLLDRPVDSIAGNFMETAQYFGRNTRAICVLKDAHTVVTRPVGSFYINDSGNCGMATAGSGDVLTGVIAGLLAEGQPVFGAATLGVYIHGLAGDVAAKELGRRSVMASDIIDGIGKVLK